MVLKKLALLILFAVTLHANAMEQETAPQLQEALNILILPTDFYYYALHGFAQELGCFDDASKKDDLVQMVHKIQCSNKILFFHFDCSNHSDVTPVEGDQVQFLRLYQAFINMLVHGSIHKLCSNTEQEELHSSEFNWHLMSISKDKFCKLTSSQNDLEYIKRVAAVKLAEQEAHTTLLNLLG